MKFISNNIDNRVFVISKDTICKIVSRDYAKNYRKTNISVKTFKKIQTSACSSFLAKSENL